MFDAATIETFFALLFVLTLLGAPLAVAFGIISVAWPRSTAAHSVESLWHKARWRHV